MSYLEEKIVRKRCSICNIGEIKCEIICSTQYNSYKRNGFPCVCEKCGNKTLEERAFPYIHATLTE
jgi:hypothetical protein